MIKSSILDLFIITSYTEFSNIRLRDCIIKVEDLIWGAVELGHEVVAITDHENISSHVKAEKIYKKVKEKHPNFKMILGNEIYLARNGLNSENFDVKKDRYYHFILIAKDAIGHQQIREISTRAWKRSYMARRMRRVPTYYQDLVDIIASNPGHVIGSTACLGGALPTQLLKYKETKDPLLYEKILKWSDQMSGIFGKENFFFELQPSETKEQIYVNRMLVDMAEKEGYNYLITTDSHYLKKEDATIHKAFLNAQNGDREVDSFYATTYMMGTEELESYMKLSREELDKAYDNILKIKNMVEDYSLLKPLRIPLLPWKEVSYIATETKDKWFQRIPNLSEFYLSDNKSDNHLAKILINELETNKKLHSQEIYDEINDCLKMTLVSSKKSNAEWSAYYLNLQKIIEECWNAGTIVGPGRGSGVGFILLYLLEITQINPLWENTRTFPWRFLNPDRASVLD